MTPFELLLCAHIIGDWMLSGAWFAKHKHKLTHPASWIHATINGVTAGGAAWLAGVPVVPVAIFLGVTHVLLDTRYPVRWLMRVTRKDDFMWLVIVIDQMLHVLLIAVAVLVAVR